MTAHLFHTRYVLNRNDGRLVLTKGRERSPQIDHAILHGCIHEIICGPRQLAKLGMGDIEKRIRFERIVTPVEWESKVGIYKGATFNLAHSLGQMLHLRPQNRFEEFDRMYLVGGGTHPGSGLPVIFESARISARLLLEDLGQAA